MGKNSGKWTWAISALAVFYSCTGIKTEIQQQKSKQPVLGSVVVQGSQWLSTQTQEIGQLYLKKPLPIKVVELPFNKGSYGKYRNYLKHARKANTVPYNDSLPISPKYVRLQLVDLVGITQILNAQENKALCDYIVQDSDHALVSGIDFTATDENLRAFLNATHVFLDQDDLGKFYFSLILENKEQYSYFEELQIFGSETLSFCWAEDHRLQKQVVHLVEYGKRCAKGSHKKAGKTEREREYLKF